MKKRPPRRARKRIGRMATKKTPKLLTFDEILPMALRKFGFIVIGYRKPYSSMPQKGDLFSNIWGHISPKALLVKGRAVRKEWIDQNTYVQSLRGCPKLPDHCFDPEPSVKFLRLVVPPKAKKAK